MKLRLETAVGRLSAIGAALLLASIAAAGCGENGSIDSVGTAQESVVVGNGPLSISGAVSDANGNPLPGVTVALGGSHQATTTTPSNGTYQFTGLTAGSYSVQVSLAGCSFNSLGQQSVQNLNNVTASRSNVNFGPGSGSTCGGTPANSGATSGAFTVSGAVTDSSGHAVPGVKVTLGGTAQGYRTTTATGTYAFQVNQGSYSLQPSGGCSSFKPPSINLNGVASNLANENFVGTACSGVSDAGVDSCTPKTMAQACGTNTCGSAPNGCGGTVSCGSCSDAQVCSGTGGSAGTCGCVPETAKQACGTNNCGMASDGCGGTVSCGTCSTPPNTSCSGANGAPGTCTCVPQTVAQACGANTCGSAPNGCGGTVSCGSCEGGACSNTSGGAGTCCTALTACPTGDNCGTVSNGCGGTVTCAPNSCASPQTCGGGGTVNQCGCTAKTAAQACGSNNCGTASDGCGGTVNCGPLAGACPTAAPNCNMGVCQATCATPTCPTGDNCGTASVTCSDGTVKTQSCGTCATGQTCQISSGTEGSCCTPLTVCPANTCGTISNGCGGTLSCGTAKTVAQACGADNCGTAPDGCGGTVTCGTCAAGSTCSVSTGAGTCTCTPKTQAQVCGTGATADNCGSAADGCGGTVTCGPACTAPATCSGVAGAPGTCGCTPQTTTQACGTNTCGNAPDGCGGTVSCGTCATGTSCSSSTGAGTCAATAGCATPAGTTSSIISTLGGAACLSCAQANGCLDVTQQGINCEDSSLAGNGPALLAGALPDGTASCGTVFGCTSGASPTQAQICLDSLSSLFTSHCGNTGTLNPCLCGTTATATCQAGTATPTGALWDTYECNFATTSGAVALQDLQVQTFGAGAADSIVACLQQSGCTCTF